jgi:G3E family GTPase
MSSHTHKSKRGFDEMRGPVPVTVLSGFLGAGKTTLLKFILETKHKEQGGGKGSKNAFRCAVIVNDVAELNIDEKLIVDQSTDIVQSDDVVAMQNGCVCCTLKNDLVDQITKLAASGSYDYLILEASGVSEPAEIAKIFQEHHCDSEEGHDHDEHHGHDDSQPHLSQVARLDTLVTVVDASALLETNLQLWLGTGGTGGSSSASNTKNNLSQLLAEQVEYANVILLNKIDLVTEEQMEEVIATRIRPLNSHADLLTCRNSQIDVQKVVDTRSYRAETFGFEQLVSELNAVISDETKHDDDENKATETVDCCAKSKSQGLQACCPSEKKNKNTLDSGVSQVVLGDTKSESQQSRHGSRFGITSFLYRARRPFHPGRFNKEFISKYFLYYDPHEEEEEEHADEEENSPSPPHQPTMEMLEQVEDQAQEEENNEAMTAKAYREVARQRRHARTRELGQLLRTKGFLWLADSNDMLTTISHAGNLVTLDSPGFWTALNPKAYNGTAKEKEKLCKQWEGHDKFKDRRQELVFIGQELNHKFIQAILDECLLDDEEFKMGIDYWKANMGDSVLEIAATEE